MMDRSVLRYGPMARHPKASWALCAYGAALCLAAGCDMNPRPQDPDLKPGTGVHLGSGGSFMTGGPSNASGGAPLVVGGADHNPAPGAGGVLITAPGSGGSVGIGGAAPAGGAPPVGGVSGSGGTTTGIGGSTPGAGSSSGAAGAFGTGGSPGNPPGSGGTPGAGGGANGAGGVPTDQPDAGPDDGGIDGSAGGGGGVPPWCWWCWGHRGPLP
jgi:hypothetical protein